jgi:hypothetical protein
MKSKSCTWTRTCTQTQTQTWWGTSREGQPSAEEAEDLEDLEDMGADAHAHAHTEGGGRVCRRAQPTRAAGGPELRCGASSADS